METTLHADNVSASDPIEVPAAAYFAREREIHLSEVRAIKEAARKDRRDKYVAFAIVALLVLTTPILATILTKHVIKEPFVIFRDADGRTQITRINSGERTYDEGFNRRSITDYLDCREGYLRASFVARDVPQCLAMTPDSGRETLMSIFGHHDPKKYPNNYYAVYGDNGSRIVKVTSISYLETNVALVRYSVKETRQGAEPRMFYWIATMQFKYDTGKVPTDEFEANPVGFMVYKFEVAEDKTVTEVK